MIQVDFNILNQKGSPALYQDTFASRPAASLAGRIFLATDTGNLYRDTGTTWVQIATGGGPGVTPGIDDVLAVGQKFTADRDIDCNGKEFLLQNAKLFTIENQSGSAYFQQSGSIVRFGDLSNAGNRLKFILDDFNSILYTTYGGNDNGVKIDFINSVYTFGVVSDNYNIKIDGNAGNIIIGDYLFYANSTQIYLDGPNIITYTYDTVNSGVFANGINFDFFNRIYQLGAVNSYNQTSLNIDDTAKRFFTSYYDGANTKVIGFDIIPTQTNFGLMDAVTGVNFSMYMAFVNDPLGSGDEFIVTNYKGNSRGLFLNFYSDIYYLGDFAQITGASFIAIDEVSQRITHYTNNFYLNDLGTGNLIQSTPSGPATGDHLKININGVDYVIELKTP